MKAGKVRYKGYSIVKGNSLGQGFEEDRRGRPGIYLQHNPEKTKHRFSPENRRNSGESHKEVRNR